MLLFDLADISDHLAKLVDFNNKEGIVLLHVANNKNIFIMSWLFNMDQDDIIRIWNINCS